MRTTDIIIWIAIASAFFGGCIEPIHIVRREAASDFHCEEDHLDVQRRDSESFVVTGCDRQGVYQCADVGGETRCSNVAWMARTRAAREFNCDAFAVDLEEVSPFVFRVAGCEQEAIFHCEIEGGRARCLREGEAVIPRDD